MPQASDLRLKIVSNQVGAIVGSNPSHQAELAEID